MKAPRNCNRGNYRQVIRGFRPEPGIFAGGETGRPHLNRLSGASEMIKWRRALIPINKFRLASIERESFQGANGSPERERGRTRNKGTIVGCSLVRSDTRRLVSPPLESLFRRRREWSVKSPRAATNHPAKQIRARDGVGGRKTKTITRRGGHFSAISCSGVVFLPSSPAAK